MENDEIIKYTATILVGDEYHPTGETHPIWEGNLEYTKQKGLKLKVKENSFGVVYYHIYPCTITRTRYKTIVQDVTTFAGGNLDGEIGYDKVDFSDKNYTDRW